MVSERLLSSRARLSRHMAGVILMSMVFCPAGNIMADPAEKAGNVLPAKGALLGVPLSFEANQGQSDSRVKFLSRGDGYSLFLTSNEAVFMLRTPADVKAPPSVFRVELRGSNRGAQVTGVDKLAGVANYYAGKDPTKWSSGITTYGKVKYQGIYPGIDAVFYGNQRQLEYDFVVAPGADPRQISLGLAGARPRLDDDGNVVLKLADGDLGLRKPVVYQNVAGAKKIIEGTYTIADNKVGFHLGKYDHNQTLVIDPVFTYLTYLGGGSVDRIGSITTSGQVSSPNQALAIDSAGNVYVAGETLSTDFPVVNAYQSTTKTPGYTAFVSALNSTGTALLYSTYLGGSVSNGGNPGSDIASSIAWDSLDNAVYVVGTATNSDFPTTPGAFQTKNPNGLYFPFVAKLSTSGQLTNSTFLGAGGAGYEYGLSVAADSLGQAYIGGYTSYIHCTPQTVQNCFPTTPGALIPGSNVAGDSNFGNGFVSVLNPSLSTLLYSTLLGDPNGASNGYGTEVFGVTVDPNGNFYVVGQTGAATLPVTSGAFQKTLVPSNGVPVAGFAAKFGPVSAKGATLLYLTYLEATGLGFTDIASGVAADSQGNAYIGGYTHSPTFPVTSSAIQNICDPSTFPYNCAFVAKLNSTGTGLVWSTFVEPASFLTAITLDTQGNVYVAGNNNGFFQAVNAVEPGLNQGGAFVAKLNPAGSALLFSSLIGGTDGVGSLAVTGLAVDATGNIYIAGYDRDTTLPTTPGAFQTALKNPGTGNSYDGYIGKISLGAAPTIREVDNAFSNIPNSPIQSGTWVAIKGSNLSNSPGRGWNPNESFPTSMDGTSVTINGKPAFLYYISPAQVNVQAPSDDTLGPVSVVVANNSVNSAPATVQYQASSPALLQWGGGQYAYAEITRNPDNAYIGNPGIVPGTVAAKAGDILTLWVTGLGATNPPLPAGQQPQPVNGSFPTVSIAPTVTVGGVNVTVLGSILRFAGLYQVNAQLPASAPSGNLPIKVIQGSYQSPDGVLVTVQ